MKRKDTFRFACIEGDGLGPEYMAAVFQALNQLNVPHDHLMIKEYRNEDGLLRHDVLETLKDYPVILKGPMETEVGTGAPSITGTLRRKLGLAVNLRPVCYFPGIHAPLRSPERLDMLIFRENTEDLYAGIGWRAGSSQANKFHRMLFEEMHVPTEKLPYKTTSFAVKPVSKEATEHLMHFAIRTMLEQGRKHLVIVHKGNIMKETEGMFLEWSLAVAKAYDSSWGKEIGVEEERSLKISSLIADDAFQQILLKPNLCDGMVTLNLNGDYLSDAAAGAIGGATLCASVNIGQHNRMYEAIGGTGKDLVGTNTMNPTPMLMALSMALRDEGFKIESNAISEGLRTVFKSGRGTADVSPYNPGMTTDEFLAAVMQNAIQVMPAEMLAV